MARAGHHILARSEVPPLSYLPTLGAPASSFDFVDTVAVEKSGFLNTNACFIDVHAANALGRIIEGPIQGTSDLVAAEAALRALFFHDHISILTTGVGYNGGVVRAEATRPNASFDAFRGVDLWDEVVIIEHLEGDPPAVIRTTFESTVGIVGKDVHRIGDSYLDRRPLAAAAVSQMPSLFSLPAYFSDPRIEPFFHHRGFSGKLYETIGASVLERGSVVPGSDIEIELPLLLWVLMDGAASRQNIPEAIAALRTETAAARRQLQDIDVRMRSAANQAQREDTARFYQESFEAIVAAARQRNAGTVRQVAYQLIDFARAPVDALASRINPEWRTKNSRRVANRSIISSTFAHLLKTDTARTLIDHFFTGAEISALEREAQDR